MATSLHTTKIQPTFNGQSCSDLVNNRTKRIFKDRTGQRCGANTNPMLLQTYKRDTGKSFTTYLFPFMYQVIIGEDLELALRAK